MSVKTSVHGESALGSDKHTPPSVGIEGDYKFIVQEIENEQLKIKTALKESVFQRYILIILITLCGSLQIALNYRLTNGYYGENSHLILSAMNNRSMDTDDTDNKFSINDMSDFSDTFINSLQNLAAVSDNIFQYEPLAGQEGNFTQYSLEVFHKLTSTEDTGPTEHLQVLELTEDALVNLTPENFGVNTGLGFDITNASQLRYFLSDLYYISARATNLTLLSFDNENSLNCQNWTMTIDFNFNSQDDVIVTKKVEYSAIPCQLEWKQELNYTQEDYEEAPIRLKVGSG